MTTETAQTTLAVLAVSGALGYLMPSVDKALESDPRTSGIGNQLAKSGSVVAIVSLGAGIVGSYVSRSFWSFGVALTFTLLTFHFYGEAYHTVPERS